jgi:adenylate cyclase class 2
MSILNFEFKARAADVNASEKKLQSLNPKYIGEDNQTDTYFNVHRGRLKLREGNIENALIWYERANTANAKQSDVLLYKHSPDKTLKEILATALGIKIVVSKKRKIYFIGNVKFHFDTVAGLGTFIEVEAIDTDNEFGIEKLREQCDHYANFFGITTEDYASVSYSDMMLDKGK